MSTEIAEQFSSWNAVIDKIISGISKDSQKILIQSGHFSLLFDKSGHLVPAIKEEITDVDLKEFICDSNYMGDFPVITLKNGILLASMLKNKGNNIKFTFIVNDWQWVNKGLYSFKVNRYKFFSKPTLPETYQNMFREYSFSQSDIINTDHYVDKGIYFSEHKLRKYGKKKILNCSPDSCAIEYLPFLNEILNQYDVFISFIPMSCKIPILYSAVRFIQSQDIKTDLVHIFYDPETKKIELSMLNQDILNQEYIDKINERYQIMELMSK